MSVKIAVSYKKWDASWCLIGNANASFDADKGVSFNKDIFSYNKGEEFANYLEGALADFGAKVAADYGVVSICYDFEDGNGEWMLMAVN